MRKDFLVVEAPAVVDGAGDVFGFEGFGEVVAVFWAYRILGVDVGVAGVDDGCGDVVFERLAVALAHLLAELNFLVAEVGEFGLDNGGLQAVAAAVGTEGVVRLAFFAAVVGDGADGFGQVGVFGKNGPAVAITTEWLGGEEAGGGDVPHGASLAAALLGSEALSGVFDDFQAVLFGDGFEGRVVGHLAEEIDGDDRLGLRGDGFLDLPWVDVVGVGLNIGKNGRGSHECDGLGGANPGEWSGDHFVVRADPEGAEGDFECHRAAGDGDAVDGFLGCAEKSAERGFQFIDLGSVDVTAVGKYLSYGRVNLGGAAAVDGFDVDKLH